MRNVAGMGVGYTACNYKVRETDRAAARALQDNRRATQPPQSQLGTRPSLPPLLSLKCQAANQNQDWRRPISISGQAKYRLIILKEPGKCHT